ncbi:hypothetical protein [uncultured Bartonella sp.]|uniref:hypothetical protein n=1 Tax=uncultured Bartonella sp. TaxID=104108 RepID=UPI0025D7ADA7|nr:hypothetical protein [uncultured Bartonella sp.]
MDYLNRSLWAETEMLEMMTDKQQQQTIGEIKGKLDLLIEDMKVDSQKRDEQDDRLARIERSQDELGRRIEHSQDDLSKRIDGVLKRIESVEKPVAEFNRWRERAIGALMLVSLVAALIGGAIAAYWHKIVDAFR